MSEAIYNARNLRAIGQDLEARGITQFELMPAADGYLVRFLMARRRLTPRPRLMVKPMAGQLRHRVSR